MKKGYKRKIERNLTSPQVKDERLELLFRHTGLSEKQASLYGLLLISGEARASLLSQKSGIKRSSVYVLLRDLRLKGLVTEFEKGKITYFRPESPAKLIDIVNAREKDLNIAKDLTNDLLPKLTQQWKNSINRPTVRYYEGQEGLLKIFTDIYGPKNDSVYGCVDLEKVDSVFPDYLAKSLIPVRIKNNIFAYSLISASEPARQIQKDDNNHLRLSLLLDKNKYPLPAEIDVYEDKIALLSFEKAEFIGIIIQNQVFADSLKSIFKFCFALNALLPADPKSR